MEINIATLTPPVDCKRDHMRGDPGAPVALVEFGDFQCPDCGNAYPVVHELLARFGNRLRFGLDTERFERELRERRHAPAGAGGGHLSRDAP
jgi:hypothetical protein